jgi:hypothetical protein
VVEGLKQLRSLSLRFTKVTDEGLKELVGNLFRQRGVLVPAGVEQLHEAHPALHQPSRQQAVGGVGAS